MKSSEIFNLTGGFTPNDEVNSTPINDQDTITVKPEGEKHIITSILVMVVLLILAGYATYRANDGKADPEFFNINPYNFVAITLTSITGILLMKSFASVIRIKGFTDAILAV